MTRIAGRRRRVLDAAHDLGEVRVGDVVDDDADDRDVALEQPAGERVRDVVELRAASRTRSRVAGADRRSRRRGHDARHGRRRDAGQPGDVRDGCHVSAASERERGGSSRTVTHCHSVNVSRLASPPYRPPLPDRPMPPNGIVASSLSVPSLTWTMPGRSGWRSRGRARSSASRRPPTSPYSLSLASSTRLLVAVERHDRRDRAEDLVGPGRRGPVVTSVRPSAGRTGPRTCRPRRAVRRRRRSSAGRCRRRARAASR